MTEDHLKAPLAPFAGAKPPAPAWFGEALAIANIHFVDVGTSGGVFGLERGFCLMVCL